MPSSSQTVEAAIMNNTGDYVTEEESRDQSGIFSLVSKRLGSTRRITDDIPAGSSFDDQFLGINKARVVAGLYSSPLLEEPAPFLWIPGVASDSKGTFVGLGSVME